MAARRWCVAVLACLGVLLAGACREARPTPTPTPTTSTTTAAVRPAWLEVTLPTPAGAPGRVQLRDAVACAGRWFVVGAVAGPAGETRPAAWTSGDTRVWTSLSFSAHSPYGPENTLYSAACRDGRLAAVGSRSGGAHANPRVSTWWQRPDGTLVEAHAPFERYGGPQAVNVARMVAGPPGWLITGNRMSGAAVWVSPDAVTFDLVEREPRLANDPAGQTWLFDAVPTGDGWLAAGGLIPPGRTDRDPLLWTSSDGRTWTRVPVPGTAEYEELRRVVTIGATVVAVGPRGATFGAWRGGEAGWTAVGRFGQLAGGIPSVPGLVAVPGGLLAAVADGTTHTLWLSADLGASWRPVAGPAALPAGTEQIARVAADRDTTLLFADDGRSARVWVTARL
ncbi:MAG TPA: hypothetical protein VF755_08290 [Catenuloplanes sp.]|jgi:hypothetical protein